MNLIQDCRNDKLSVVALHKIVQELASDFGLILEGPLSKICTVAGVNRTQVYERKKQLEEALNRIELAGPGRPASLLGTDTTALEKQGWQLCAQVLRFRLHHPGALVLHAGGHATYSDGFIRFILDLHDTREGSSEQFCEQVEVPYQTLRSWSKRDQGQPHEEHLPRLYPLLADGASNVARKIAEDYSVWEGSLRDFLKYEATRLHLGPTEHKGDVVVFVEIPALSIRGTLLFSLKFLLL